MARNSAPKLQEFVKLRFVMFVWVKSEFIFNFVDSTEPAHHQPLFLAFFVTSTKLATKFATKVVESHFCSICWHRACNGSAET